MKTQYRFIWEDATKSTGNVPRSRVAYSLRAARSRGTNPVKTANGWRIGQSLFWEKQISKQ